MPKGRAAAAISTGHGSFHLGDRTESRNECKHSISEVFAKSIGSSPGPNRSASGSAARSNLCNSPATAQRTPREYSLVFKDIDMKRAEATPCRCGGRKELILMI